MNAYLKRRAHYRTLFPDPFIDRSAKRVSQAKIDNLGMVVSRDDQVLLKVSPKVKSKKLRSIMKSVKERT